MASPWLAHIQRLMELAGEPAVSFPSGDPDYPQTERVMRVTRGAHILEIGAAEPNSTRFPGCVLVDQREVGGDKQFVQMYRRYQTLPGGTVAVSRELVAGGSAGSYFIERGEELVAADTMPSVGAAERSEVVLQQSRALAVRQVDVWRHGDGSALAGVPPWITYEWSYDSEADVLIYRSERDAERNIALPARGATFSTSPTLGGATISGWVHDSAALQIPGSTKMRQIVEWSILPLPRFDIVPVGYQFPAIFEVLDETWIEAGDDDGFTTPKPWLGVHFRLKGHRTAVRPGKEWHIYRVGPPSIGFLMPETFTVDSPGSGSRIWSIPTNCIHPDLSISELGSVSGQNVLAVVETFEASRPRPDEYDDDSVICVRAEARRWRGNIYDLTITQASYNKHPLEDSFPNPLGSTVNGVYQ